MPRQLLSKIKAVAKQNWFRIMTIACNVPLHPNDRRFWSNGFLIYISLLERLRRRREHFMATGLQQFQMPLLRRVRRHD